MNEHKKSNQICYELDGITWLPHYQHEGIFVSPSDKVGKTEPDLIKLGATQTTKHLWNRAYTEA